MTVIAFTCLHSPYHHPDALDFLSDTKRKWKATEAVCLGDEADRHRLSSHPQEHDCYDAETEFRLAKEFLTDLGKLFPTLKLCTSNHVERRQKAANRANLSRSELKSWAEAIDAPRGWKWADDWIIQGVNYFHGTELSGRDLGRQAVNLKRRSVVFGHWHTRAEVSWFRSPHWTNFAMSTGCLFDVNSPAARYSRNRTTRPVEGCGIVADGVPFYEPLEK